VHLRLTKDRLIDTTCWDTSCNTLLIDRSWLKRILLGSKIYIIAITLIIKSIESNSYNTNEYVILNLRVPGYNQENIEPIKIILYHEFYVINKFLINILIGINVIVP
jgi:hypothetical protein